MIRLFFGRPGCGKTTLVCKMLKQKQEHYSSVWSNVRNAVPGHNFYTDLEDLGEYTIPWNAYLAVDEAGIQYNNRSFKTLPKSAIKWFKLHRHFGVDIDMFSQSWEDTDITIRRLTDELWYCYRIGPWTLCRRVYKRIMVDQNTHQIVDGYSMPNFLWLLVWPLWKLKLCDAKFMLTFRPFYYKYFDSWERMELPEYPRLDPSAPVPSSVPSDSPDPSITSADS